MGRMRCKAVEVLKRTVLDEWSVKAVEVLIRKCSCVKWSSTVGPTSISSRLPYEFTPLGAISVPKLLKTSDSSHSFVQEYSGNVVDEIE